ncbi:hypothetical protein BA950_01220 [Erythrobacter sp. SAORIC-644]|uniref:hypothetical protein n=1 Tax=Erythrobacter sp. SAORIC-644 TaxID=1869314 RepID=UPI000C9FC523|nr:hypothetical protein [Erythrobacter sp. SAORIC-644]PNQ77685.1 hypothetical protein BA950_01220 [Erythrobacter sp. SAORIC-644]
MHDYNLEYVDDDGVAQTISFSALTPNGALDRAMTISPGRCAKLRDEEGDICRIERLSHSAVWRIARAA